jgi:hypothetical protein
MLKKPGIRIQREIAYRIIVVKTNGLPHRGHFLLHHKQNATRAEARSLIKKAIQNVALSGASLHRSDGRQQFVTATPRDQRRLQFLHGAADEFLLQFGDASVEHIRRYAPHNFVNPGLIGHFGSRHWRTIPAR